MIDQQFYESDCQERTSVAPVHSGRQSGVYLPITERVLGDLAAIPGVDAAAVRMQTPFAASRPRAPGVIVVARDMDDASMTLDNGQQIERALQATNRVRRQCRLFPRAGHFTHSGTRVHGGRQRVVAAGRHHQ